MAFGLGVRRSDTGLVVKADRSRFRFPTRIPVLIVTLVVGVGLADPAVANHVPSGSPVTAAHGPQLVIPIMSPRRGKQLFVDKGCIACHSINGLGGHDAPNMDAHAMTGLMNPFDFAAKMWNHAPAMIAAQESAIGDQVYFTGQELADIIAFVHDDQAQHSFSEKDMTAQARKLMDHSHGGAGGPAVHAKELGHHKDPPGAPPHKH